MLLWILVSAYLIVTFAGNAKRDIKLLSLAPLRSPQTLQVTLHALTAAGVLGFLLAFHTQVSVSSCLSYLLSHSLVFMFCLLHHTQISVSSCVCPSYLTFYLLLFIFSSLHHNQILVSSFVCLFVSPLSLPFITYYFLTFITPHPLSSCVLYFLFILLFTAYYLLQFAIPHPSFNFLVCVYLSYFLLHSPFFIFSSLYHTQVSISSRVCFSYFLFP